MASGYNTIKTINLGTMNHIFANASEASMGVFSGCTNVEKVIIGNSKELSEQTVANIRNNVFSGAIGVGSPEGVVEIYSADADALETAFAFPARFTTINKHTVASQS